MDLYPPLPPPGMEQSQREGGEKAEGEGSRDLDTAWKGREN